MVCNKLEKTIIKRIVETKLCEMCNKNTGDNEHNVYGTFAEHSVDMGAL